MSKQNRWDRCNRNSEKAIKAIRRTANQRDVELVERQTGSHWIGKVPGRGSVVVPRSGEIPKGTWYSILKMLKAIGLIALIVMVIYFGGWI